MKTNTKTKREVVIWVILVLIAMAAASVITVVSEKLNSSALGDEPDFGWQPNFRQVLSALGYEFFIVFMKIFVVLGIGRVIFLFASNRIRSKNGS